MRAAIWLVLDKSASSSADTPDVVRTKHYAEKLTCFLVLVHGGQYHALEARNGG